MKPSALECLDFARYPRSARLSTTPVAQRVRFRLDKATFIPMVVPSSPTAGSTFKQHFNHIHRPQHVGEKSADQEVINSQHPSNLGRVSTASVHRRLGVSRIPSTELSTGRFAGVGTRL